VKPSDPQNATDCLSLLALALIRIREDGRVVIDIRGHEGRGIGLSNKLFAYDLQAHGRDSVDANTELGLPVDTRNILRHLRIESFRLVTNNRDNVQGLAKAGVKVEQVPHNAGACTDNLSYRNTKRVTLGESRSTNNEAIEGTKSVSASIQSNS
jgi:3,4-dihydroxy 2-butanone 4-phosphate synthase/GTP cyclohydrolase II